MEHDEGGSSSYRLWIRFWISSSDPRALQNYSRPGLANILSSFRERTLHLSHPSQCPSNQCDISGFTLHLSSGKVQAPQRQLWWWSCHHQDLESPGDIVVTELQDWVLWSRQTHPECEWYHAVYRLERRLRENKKVSWAPAPIPLCFLIVDAMSPAASHSCCHAYTTMVECTLKLWAI